RRVTERVTVTDQPRQVPQSPIVSQTWEAFADRLRALDAKLTLVNNIFNLQSQPEPGEANDIKYETDSLDSYDSDDSDAPYTETRVRDVMDETIRLLGQLNLSHRQYQRARRRRRAKLQSKKQLNDGSSISSDLEAARKISTKAYLEGKPAIWGWMHWSKFANALRLTLEESINNPIVAVIGELDSQALSRIPSGFSPGQQDMLLNHPERDAVTWDPVRGLLPERVKFHSNALRSVFIDLADIDKAEFLRQGGPERDMVFLRPFKEFVYNEGKLRAHLAKLEMDYDALKKSGKLFIEAHEPRRDDDEGRQEDTEGHTSGTESDGEVTNADRPQSMSDSIEALLHLRCLMDFFDIEVKPKLEYYSSDQCRKILFHDLWHIYKPGDVVVDQAGKRAFRVIQVQSPHHQGHDVLNRFLNAQPTDEASKAALDRQTMKVDCVYIDFNGKAFGPVKVTFTIFPFGGLKDVESLPIYPLRLSKEVGLRDRLVARGKMLMDTTSLQPMYYTGTALNSGEEIDSQVIVDLSEALADEKRRTWAPVVEPIGNVSQEVQERCSYSCCHTSFISRGSYIDFRLTKDFMDALVPKERFQALLLILSPRPLGRSVLGTEYEPKDEDFLIMTYRVFGFVLRTRKWAQLDLTYLRYENQDARDSTLGAFDRLELPTGHREMVKSLVTQHFRGKRASIVNVDRTDIVRGKGKGLVMLLHGAPGVGKTTTAEGVAELFQKPLFHITCGDLGTTARDVEQELEKNFALASRWGCILLLDEADVFLSARERKDFERNGLVAGLCVSDPYGSFFKVNLDLIQERFDRQGRKIIYDRSSIENFADQHFRTHVFSRWNGRQIRNACQTALALAEYDAHGDRVPEEDDETDAGITVALELRHFQLVQTAYLDCAKYLGDIRGTQGDRRAIDYGLRAESQTPYQTMEPGCPSTPSNGAGFSASRYPARPLSTSYNAPYEGPRYPSQRVQAADASHPPVSQDEISGSDSAYTAGPTSSMGPQIYRQHGQPPSQNGPGGVYNMQANPQGQGYSYPGNQPRLYQSASEQGYGQSWGSSGPGMQQGGGIQGPTTGEGFPVQGQTPYSGQGSATGA
ncbi:hypothetical protein PG991_013221, partial [Apiospora marii]